jgi:hypothetical protein
VAERGVISWVLEGCGCVAVRGEQGGHVGYPAGSVVTGGDDDELLGVARVENRSGDGGHLGLVVCDVGTGWMGPVA